MILNRIICIVIGYCFGLFASGFFIGKLHKMDLRDHGSGNIGTTNALRTMGPAMGALTLFLDFLKCVLAVVVVWAIFHNSQPEHVRLLMLYGGVGVILGHDFPFYMNFKGGKGIASSLGLVTANYPIFLPVAAGIFVLSVAITKYVSLGSILACISLIVQVFVFGSLGMLGYSSGDLLEAQIVTCLFATLNIILHHANIKRLIAGNENKLSFRSKRD